MGDNPDAGRALAISCSLQPLDQLSATDIEGWSALGDEAVEDNPYLLPEFILPSLRLRSDPNPPLVLIARADGEGESEICGLGVFEPAEPTRRFPFAHLEAYRSRHSFLTGLLLREDVQRAAARAMMMELVRGRHRWHAVHFTSLRMQGRQAELLRSVWRECGISWFEDSRSSRAGLDLTPERRSAWEDHVSRQRHKDVRRCKRKLEKEGTLTWEYVRGQDIDATHIETFLDLEHRGWKSGANTSLRSSPEDEVFFRELVERHAERGSGFFTELKVGDRVVASTSNLTAGEHGFAFKVAFDPELRKASPGIVNEYMFLEALDTIPGLRSMDSGAEEGSFIDSLWPERISLGEGYLVGRTWAKAAMSGLRALRFTREAVRARLSDSRGAE